MSPYKHSKLFSPWLAHAILVLLVLALVVVLAAPRLQANRPPAAAASSVPPAVSSWGDTYCYGGTPKPLPACAEHLLILTNRGYLTGYSEMRKDPLWVCYRLGRVNSFQAPPRPKGFKVDLRTRARVAPGDYTGSGYDRGHLAPNYAMALCYGAEAQMETFLMSNILPQRPKLNRRLWERLEQREVRDYAARYDRIWVMNGPVFDGAPALLKGGVQVPAACFKIIVDERNGLPHVLAFRIPQSVSGDEAPDQFVTSVRRLEAETGLDFLADLPRGLQDRLETTSSPIRW